MRNLLLISTGHELTSRFLTAYQHYAQIKNEWGGTQYSHTYSGCRGLYLLFLLHESWRMQNVEGDEKGIQNISQET